MQNYRAYEQKHDEGADYMETIINYLDNMFVNFPQTPEVMRAKENLAEMMEDKYNELIQEGKMENEAIGIVISEFGNIKELADELGEPPFHTENDRKTEQESENKKKSKKHKFNFSKIDIDENKMRHISEVEAEEYLFLVKQSSEKLACGVFLCICSPILLLLLAGISSSIYPIAQEIVGGVGVSILLIMVACALGLFISTGMKLDTYEYLKKECFTIDNEYRQTLINIRESRKRLFVIKITAGVIMCIVSVVPLLILSAVSNLDEFLILVGVAILLFIVGIAVALFITAGMEQESYDILLQEKDFTIKKKSNKFWEKISAVYWPLVAVIYLLWSFHTDHWEITWVIWPIAGILCNIIF